MSFRGKAWLFLAVVVTLAAGGFIGCGPESSEPPPEVNNRISGAIPAAEVAAVTSITPDAGSTGGKQTAYRSVFEAVGQSRSLVDPAAYQAIEPDSFRSEPTQPKPTAPQTPPPPYYTVQTATFSSPRQAIDGGVELKKRGLNAFTLNIKANGRYWVILCHGRFESASAARQSARRLKDQGRINDFIIRRVYPHTGDKASPAEPENPPPAPADTVLALFRVDADKTAGPPAKPTPNTPPAQRPAARASSWTIQSGSYIDPVNAREETDRLAASGYPAFTRSKTVADQTFHRVCLGRYASREHARAEAEQLQNQGVIRTFRIIAHPGP
jgi:cell division septation protein DedD